MAIDIFDFLKKMDKENVLLSFKGSITSDLLTSVLQVVESKMDSYNEPSRLKKKVYNILVESLQNLYHHFDKKGDHTSAVFNTVVFMITKDKTDYSIYTGNYILNNRVAALEEKLNKINSLDTDELKQYYKEELNNGMMSEKGGGGLGMIDIARKSGQKLEFDFQKVDEHHSFYSLNIKIAQ